MSEVTQYIPPNGGVQSGAIRPDAVYDPSGDEANNESWRFLDPCPTCGARPHDAPEGTTLAGDPAWVYEHCWRCGYRPGTNVAFDVERMRQEFDAFRRFQQESLGSHPTLSPPENENQIAELQAQMAELREQLAARGPVVDPTSSEPMTTPEPTEGDGA